MATTLIAAGSRPKTDDYFFAGMSLLAVLTVFMGFARSYFLAGFFHAHLPSLLVHVHGAIFSCWMLLLPIQIGLVSFHRVSWHRQLGIFGMVLAAVMLVVGSATILAGVRRHFLPGMLTQTIFEYDAQQLLLFAVLVALGFAARRDGSAHKRWMILATVAILGPALSRLDWSLIATKAGFFFVLDWFLILLVVYDLWSRRSVHGATFWGSLSIVALQFVYTPLSHAAFWHRFTVFVQSF